MANVNPNERIIVKVEEASFPGSGQTKYGEGVMWSIGQNFMFEGTREQCTLFALKYFDTAYERFTITTQRGRNFRTGSELFKQAIPIVDIKAEGAPLVDQKELQLIKDITENYRANLNEEVAFTVVNPLFEMDSVPIGEVHYFKGKRSEVLAYLMKSYNGNPHYLGAQFSLEKIQAVSNVGTTLDSLLDYQAYNEVTMADVAIINTLLGAVVPMGQYYSR